MYTLPSERGSEDRRERFTPPAARHFLIVPMQ